VAGRRCRPDEPAPVIIGALPTPAPDTGPVSAPQGGALAAWRGSFAEFLDWLATNNGASRRLESRLGISAAGREYLPRLVEAQP
jgi:hypothetical protein